jgi:hypothetical protein
MDEPPFSLAFVMVKESFAGPAILFYLASDANKNKRQDHLTVYAHRKKQVLLCKMSPGSHFFLMRKAKKQNKIYLFTIVMNKNVLP